MDLGKEKEWQTSNGNPNKDWKELKKQFDEKPESKQTTLPFDESLNGKNVLSKMPSISELWKNDSYRKRLIDTWNYAYKKEGENIKETINYFIGISKKEGRGELKTSRVLKGVFTEEIGEQLRSELLECYEIR